MSTIPYVIKKEAGTERSYDIFSMLLSERIIFLNEKVDFITSGLVIAQLLYLDNENNEDINFYIKSPGGSLTDGLAILDTMNIVKSSVSTVCVGQCASMGAILFASGAKGKSLILPNAEVMIHQPSGGTGGQSTDIQIQAKHLLFLRDKLEIILAKATGKDAKQVRIDCERDYYMTAEETIEYGLADKIIGIEEPEIDEPKEKEEK